MRRLNLTGLGGMKFTQTRLKWMQDGLSEAISAFASLCGEKTIVTGVQVAGGNVSAGWIVYEGEMIEFLAGSYGPQVVINDVANSYTYANNTVQPVELRRTASCGVVGNFQFSDLVRLSQLQNIWKPGDLRQIYKDNAYIAQNFDANGYGIGKEAGWRIFSKEVPGSAGRVFVNLDPADTDFNAAGKTAGSKTRTLTINEMPNHDHDVPSSDADGGFRRGRVKSTDQGFSHYEKTVAKGGGQPFSIVQPSFVVVTLIKI